METTASLTSSPGGASGRLAGAVAAVSGWSIRHRKLVIVGWLALVIACAAVGAMTGQRKLTPLEAGVGESGRAARVVARAGLAPAGTEMILVRSRDVATTGSAVLALTARLQNVPEVAAVRGPGQNPGRLTDGGRTALVLVTLRGPADEATRLVGPVARVVDAFALTNRDVEVLQAGDGSVSRGIDAMISDDLARAERVSLPLTLLILLLTFGALVAATVPLLLGITSSIAALGLLGPVSQLIPAHDAAGPLVVLFGLAVGVDYSLFCIRRERQERATGRDPAQALDIMTRTVGRAVVVAGLTVLIALAGLLISGLAVFASMAVVTMIVVAVAVVGSVTVLPATLAVLGDRVDRGRFPFLSRMRRRTGASGWVWIVRRVTCRPKLALAIGAATLGVLALPALHMRRADLQLGALPDSVREFHAYHQIDQAFPGSPATVELVVRGHRLSDRAARAGLERLGAEALRLSGGSGVVDVRVARDGATAIVAVPTPTGTARQTADLADRLRDVLPPLAAAVLPGSSVLVGGGQIIGVDFSTRLTVMTPIVIVAVLALAFLLIAATFRAPLLAAAVIALNLLSVAAAYGILVGVFQHRWAEGLLDFVSTGTVSNWVPLFTFVILFGLSMDYTILVLERIRESRLAGRPPREAAAEGIAATAGTVTSAALVMIVVLGMFALMRLPDDKQLGVGLAAAIALDATVVRAVLLPAAVTLVGRRWRVRPTRRSGSISATVGTTQP